ncbi:hypothetical protein EEQ60_06160 [Escherichia coli]|nr:hypothetical protein [Escherichia coli]
MLKHTEGWTLQTGFLGIVRRYRCSKTQSQQKLTAYSTLFDHGLASKSDQRFAYIRSTGNLTFSTAF